MSDIDNRLNQFKSQIAPYQAKQQYEDIFAKNRPDYEIPQAEKDFFNFQKARMGTNMPGFEQAKGDISSSTAQGIKNVKESSNSVAGTLGATTQLFGGQMKNLAQLDVANSQYQETRKDAFANAQQQMADFQDKAWTWNKGDKYQEMANYMMGRQRATDQEIQQQNANDAAKSGSELGFIGDIVKAGATIAPYL
jgi:hypothetical protein